MVGIAVRAPVPALKRTVQAGMRVATAETRQEAGASGRSGATVRQTGEAVPRRAVEVVGIGTVRGVAADATPERGEADDRPPLEAEAARREARRAMLMRRLRAAEAPEVAAPEKAAAVRPGREAKAAEEAVAGEQPEGIPVGLRVPKKERTPAEARATRSAATLTAPTGPEAVATMVERTALAVKQGLRGHGGTAHRQGEFGGARRGEFDAEADLRLELVR